MIIFPFMALHMFLVNFFVNKMRTQRVPRWEAYLHDYGFPALRYFLAFFFERAGYSGYVPHRGKSAADSARDASEDLTGESFFDVGLGW